MWDSAQLLLTVVDYKEILCSLCEIMFSVVSIFPQEGSVPMGWDKIHVPFHYGPGLHQPLLGVGPWLKPIPEYVGSITWIEQDYFVTNMLNAYLALKIEFPITYHCRSKWSDLKIIQIY